jgi:hypothetical protein
MLAWRNAFQWVTAAAAGAPLARCAAPAGPARRRRCWLRRRSACAGTGSGQPAASGCCLCRRGAHLASRSPPFGSRTGAAPSCLQARPGALRGHRWRARNRQVPGARAAGPIRPPRHRHHRPPPRHRWAALSAAAAGGAWAPVRPRPACLAGRRHLDWCTAVRAPQRRWWEPAAAAPAGARGGAVRPWRAGCGCAERRLAGPQQQGPQQRGPQQQREPSSGQMRPGAGAASAAPGPPS